MEQWFQQQAICIKIKSDTGFGFEWKYIINMTTTIVFKNSTFVHLKKKLCIIPMHLAVLGFLNFTIIGSRLTIGLALTEHA